MSNHVLSRLAQGAEITRRRLLGGAFVAAGALLAGCGAATLGARARSRGNVLLDRMPSRPRGLDVAMEFPLIDALLGRRARRFSRGCTIPDGELAFTSQHEPMPLSELEQILVLTAVSGNNGWHYGHIRNPHYAPHLSNYACAAGGRTHPSAAGFHTSEVFFTDDSGVYHFGTRDMPSQVTHAPGESVDLEAFLAAHRARIRKIADGRLHIPAEPPHMEGHNTWCVNVPGSTLIIPVADVAQHNLAVLCYLAQNGFCIFDNVHSERVPGIERFRDLVDVENPFPITYVEELSLNECTAELSTACYAGMLMLQATGLGGWMFDGIERHSVLGCSGDPGVPGLGFRADTREDWVTPNPTGLPGVFEGFCPPHFADMRAATEAVCLRKYGPGGPWNRDTPGPWRDSPRVRGSAQVHDEQFKECVALQAQFLYDRFGKFPATVPTIYVLTYLQAHHLDLDFYDHHFAPGAYLETHRRHMELWHGV